MHLIRDTIIHNQATGVFAEFQGGTATNAGPVVTFVAGVSGSFGLARAAGTQFILDGVTYQVASVTDSTHLALTTSPPDHSSPVAWVVDTIEEIRDCVINDNGLARFGGQDQVGISWADGPAEQFPGLLPPIRTPVLNSTASNLRIRLAQFSLETISPGTSLPKTGFLVRLTVRQPSSLSLPKEWQQSARRTRSRSPQEPLFFRICSLQVSGNFSQTNNCGDRVVAYGTCQVQVAFTPTTAGTETHPRSHKRCPQ